MRCNCISVDIRKTGHHQNCPEGRTPEKSFMTRTASEKMDIMIKELVATVRAQELRIRKLEAQLKTRSPGS